MGIFPTFPVVLDSCVLFPMPLRDTLLRAAEVGLYRVHWSERILADATRNLVAQGRMTPEKAARFEVLVKEAFPEAMVEVPEALSAVMTNDPGDRHVVAAAVAAKAHVIVTSNVRHFPMVALAPWQVEAQAPDVFLTHLFDLAPDVMGEVIEQQARDLRRPPITVFELLDRLRDQAPVFVEKVRRHLTPDSDA